MPKSQSKSRERANRREKLLDQICSPTWRLNYVRHRVQVLGEELDEGLILDFIGQKKAPSMTWASYADKLPNTKRKLRLVVRKAMDREIARRAAAEQPEINKTQLDVAPSPSLHKSVSSDKSEPAASEKSLSANAAGSTAPPSLQTSSAKGSSHGTLSNGPPSKSFVKMLKRPLSSSTSPSSKTKHKKSTSQASQEGNASGSAARPRRKRIIVDEEEGSTVRRRLEEASPAVTLTDDDQEEPAAAASPPKTKSHQAEPSSDRKARDSLSDEDIVTEEAAVRAAKAKKKRRKRERQAKLRKDKAAIMEEEDDSAPEAPPEEEWLQEIAYRKGDTRKGASHPPDLIRGYKGKLRSPAPTARLPYPKASPARPKLTNGNTDHQQPKKNLKRKKVGASVVSSADVGRTTLPITQNTGISWATMAPHVRNAAEILGWTRESWVPDSEYPVIFDDMYADLNKEQQKALKTMQYKVMDFNKRSSSGRRYVYDRDWDTAMTTQQRAAAKYIGWTRKIWNEGEWQKVPVHQTAWHKLTRPQLNAATTLDFGEDTWDMKAAELRSCAGSETGDMGDFDTEDEDDDKAWSSMKQRALDVAKAESKGMAGVAVYGDESPNSCGDPTHTTSSDDDSVSVCASDDSDSIVLEDTIVPLAEPATQSTDSPVAPLQSVSDEEIDAAVDAGMDLIVEHLA